MSEFYLKYQDRLPVLQSNLTDVDGYIDLSTASDVKFIHQLKSRVTTPISGSGVIVSPTSGLVQYSWPASPTLSGGVYYGEWRIEFTGGKQITIPNDGVILFKISNRIS